jgi:hypothetical protein
VAVAGLAIALGLLPACHDDNSNLPPPIIPVPNAIVVQDVNGDGLPDLLVATTADQGYGLNPGYADVILNTLGSPGTFQTGQHFATTGTNPSSIAVTRLAGGTTGPFDLVIANFGTGSVSVFMPGTTAGTYNATDVHTGGQPNQVIASDLTGNGSGPPDLVLADMSASGNVIVLMHDPASLGNFKTPMMLSTGVTTTSVAVADLNGDGAPDIVAATFDNAGNHGAVYIFYQNPNARGTFQTTPVIVPAGAQPQSVKIADLNHDNRPDIIVANFGPGTDGMGTAGVSVLLQNATGGFTGVAPVTYPTPGASIDVAVGDLLGDKNMDLVVANLAPANTGSVTVWLHDPLNPGAFHARADYPALGQPLSVVIADLNGDTHPDIAIADGPSAGVLLQNAGALGTFGAATQVGF